MLLSVHVTSVLFLVWFNNFVLTMGFYWSYVHTLTQVINVPPLQLKSQASAPNEANTLSWVTGA